MYSIDLNVSTDHHDIHFQKKNATHRLSFQSVLWVHYQRGTCDKANKAARLMSSAQDGRWSVFAMRFPALWSDSTT